MRAVPRFRELERAGVCRSAAMAMVGHKTESIYRRYAIVDAGTIKAAAARIDQAAEEQGLKTGTPPAAAVKVAGVIPKKLRRERAFSASTKIVIAPSIRIDQLSFLSSRSYCSVSHSGASSAAQASCR